jgi:hypothetical protein
MNNINRLISEYKQAKKAVEDEILRQWPKGSEIEFKIARNQKNFSTGTVYDADLHAGYLRVKHHQAKPNSRFLYRDVHYLQIKS